MKDNKGDSSDHRVIGSSHFRRFSLFPHPLSKALTQLVKPVFKKHGFAEHRILTEWHLIVGPELAAFSLPQKLTRPRAGMEGGTLHVAASAARALELQHMQPVILDKIATYFGYPAVSRLIFTHTSPVLFRALTKAPPPRKVPEHSPYAELAGGAEDESLRRVLTSLGDAISAARETAVEN